MRVSELQRNMDWAADLELLASALSAGLPIHDALLLLCQRASQSWREAFGIVAEKYDSTGNLSLSLVHAKNLVADSRFDLLAEVLIANHQLGGGGLVDWLNQAASFSRNRATSTEDNASRIRSVVGVARLGVFSPWIMAFLLATRVENLATYLAPSGLAVLTFGFSLSVFAWVAIKKSSKLPVAGRCLAA